MDENDGGTRRSKRKAKVEIVKQTDEEVVLKKNKLDEVLKKAKKSKELFAEVDEYVMCKDAKQVFIEGKDVYNVMLNQVS